MSAAVGRDQASDLPAPLRALAVAGAAFGGCATATALVPDGRSGLAALGSMVFAFPVGALIAVGTLIIVRRGRNLVGWLCWLAGVLAGFAFASGAYVEYSLSLAHALPGTEIAGWFDLWLGTAWVCVLLFIPLFFPDGRLPSPRWRPVALLVVAYLIVITMVRAFNPSVYDGAPLSYNPVGVDEAKGFFAVVDRVLAPAIILPVAAGAAALVVRFRGHRGVEQLQIKWLLYAMALMALLFFQLTVVPNALSEPMSDVVFGLGYGTLPIAIGVAVLRYRLYDIDHIIRRTIVYAVLTAALGLVYAGGVLVAGSVVIGGQPSALVVAASTLAAAALFRPLRARTQQVVDRRFNRQRYDATRTVAAFSEAVREELDDDALIRELLTVTGRIVQPTRLWLWRPTDRPRRASRAG